MKGLSLFTRCLSLMLILTLTGATAHLQAAPLTQASDPLPELPFPRSSAIDRTPHQSGIAAPANAPQHIEAATLYPYSRLTFQSARNQTDWEVYVGNDDGTGQTQITFDGASDLHPRLNRGATRVVFASRRTGNYEIFTMNPDGSGVAQLTFNDVDDVQPYWSPDGSKIVFQSYRDGQADLYVMNADGNNPVRLTTNGDYDGEPSWSPDGSKIAFVSKRTGGSGDYFVYVMNADGSGQAQLSVQAYSEGPVWSPDGTKIAYDSAGGDYWQNLWVMNADGSNQQVVFDEGGWAEAWARSWSPDSRYVAFTRIYFTPCGNNLCWTYAFLDAWDSQTGNIVRLSGNGEDWRPDWQTTDALTPNSSVSALTSPSPSPIVVRWSGTDGGPSGIAGYDVQVKDGSGGTWTNWQTNTSATSAAYPGVSGHTYYFRVRARDNASNLETYPTNPDASTTVETLAPTGDVQTLPAYTKDVALVTWGGNDPGGSGIQTYDVQYKDGAGGAWTDWVIGSANTSATFNGTVGHTYYFRARATDRAQNVGVYPTSEDAQTTFYAWGIAGIARDNTGVPVSNMNVTTQPAGPEAFGSDAAGEYGAYVLTNSNAYTVAWDKAGYDSLPATTFYSVEVFGSQPFLPLSGASLSDGLVAYWKMDEVSDMRVDATGRGNDLSDNNTVLSAGGKLGNAAQFVAANQEYLYRLDNPDLSMGNVDFTIAGWIYLNDKNGYRTLVSKWDVNNGYEYVLRYDPYSDRFVLEVSGNGLLGGISGVAANNFGSPIAGQWYWVVGWHDSVNDTLNIQVNNSAVDSISYGVGVHNGTSTLNVGFVPGFFYHDGRIDELGFWKRVLSAEERTALFNTSQGCTYPFNACDPSQSTPNEQFDIILPPADNLVVNGNFEIADLAVGGWLTSGVNAPSITNAFRHTGEQSALLGTTIVSSISSSTVAQVITLPQNIQAPTLSFLYWPRTNVAYSLTNSLVAYWKMDEVSDTRMDATGRGNDLTDNNTVTSNVGRVGQAAQFASANQEYLSRFDNPDLSMGNIDFTIAGWIYLDNKADYRVLTSKWNVDNGYEYVLRYDPYVSDRFVFEVSGNGALGGIVGVAANNFGAPVVGQWYWVVGWHDSVNDTLNIQVNNSAVDSISYDAGVYDGTSLFSVGFVHGFFYHDGRVDELGLWKRVLSVEERTALFNAGQGCTYPFLTCGTFNQSPSTSNEFIVSVDDGLTVTPIFSDTALTALNWTHQWVDLSAWAGQTITVTFTVNQGNGVAPARVYLDEVSLGSARPDVWATLEAPLTAQPGQTFVYQLTYGNQGGAIAPGTYLTLTLPPGFTYSSMSLPPVISTTTELVWDIGTLAAQGGLSSIFVIASVSLTAPALTTVTSTLTIAASNELETANNSQSASTFVGYQIFFPIIRRD